MATLAQVVLVAHLPVAGIEAVIMAATISFLARVKPEMLGLEEPRDERRGLTPPLIAGAEKQEAKAEG